jgi:hypothetical protein
VIRGECRNHPTTYTQAAGCQLPLIAVGNLRVEQALTETARQAATTQGGRHRGRECAPVSFSFNSTLADPCTNNLILHEHV